MLHPFFYGISAAVVAAHSAEINKIGPIILLILSPGVYIGFCFSLDSLDNGILGKCIAMVSPYIYLGIDVVLDGMSYAFYIVLFIVVFIIFSIHEAYRNVTRRLKAFAR